MTGGKLSKACVLGFFPASLCRIRMLLSCRCRQSTSHMGALGPVSGKKDKGEEVRVTCFCLFLKVFQFKIVNIPRCHVVYPQPHQELFCMCAIHQ